MALHAPANLKITKQWAPVKCYSWYPVGEWERKSRMIKNLVSGYHKSQDDKICLYITILMCCHLCMVEICLSFNFFFLLHFLDQTSSAKESCWSFVCERNFNDTPLQKRDPQTYLRKFHGFWLHAQSSSAIHSTWSTYFLDLYNIRTSLLRWAAKN